MLIYYNERGFFFWAIFLLFSFSASEILEIVFLHIIRTNFGRKLDRKEKNQVSGMNNAIFSWKFWPQWIIYGRNFKNVKLINQKLEKAVKWAEKVKWKPEKVDFNLNQGKELNLKSNFFFQNFSQIVGIVKCKDNRVNDLLIFMHHQKN